MRIALDFQNVLDVQSADSASYEKIQPEATQAITQCLLENRTETSSALSPTSVSTEPCSQKRRRSLREEVGEAQSGADLGASLIFDG